MRNMAFSKTVEQMRNRTKTVTRRFGWWDLKPGTRLRAVERSRGLKKGESPVRICEIEVVSVKEEYVSDIEFYSNNEYAKEGFPGICFGEFVKILCGRDKPEYYDLTVNRVEFKYVD